MVHCSIARVDPWLLWTSVIMAPVAKATSIGLVVVQRSVPPMAATPPSYRPEIAHVQPIATHTHTRELYGQIMYHFAGQKFLPTTLYTSIILLYYRNILWNNFFGYVVKITIGSM